jgi:hypothetical protein
MYQQANDAERSGGLAHDDDGTKRRLLERRFRLIRQFAPLTAPQAQIYERTNTNAINAAVYKTLSFYALKDFTRFL